MDPVSNTEISGTSVVNCYHQAGNNEKQTMDKTKTQRLRYVAQYVSCEQTQSRISTLNPVPIQVLGC